MALLARVDNAWEFQEYCAALPTWMVYLSNRGKNGQPHSWEHFMFRHRARERRRGLPATPTQAAQPPMRYARPGERPPSSRPAGTNDNVIERFDAWASKRKR
jgi:hypothetical protein